MANILTLSSQAPQLTLPAPAGSGCGPCSGVKKYNDTQEQPCDFTPASNPVISNPTSILPPQNNIRLTNPGPTTLSPVVGQTNPNYFNQPPIPQYAQNRFPPPNQMTKRCKPVPNNPAKSGRPMRVPSNPPNPIQNTNPTTVGHPDPCGKSGYYANGFSTNNQRSAELPLQTLHGQNGPILEIPRRNAPMLQLNPGVDRPPPILNSGKYRSAVTPGDICWLQ